MSVGDWLHIGAILYLTANFIWLQHAMISMTRLRKEVQELDYACNALATHSEQLALAILESAK
jgi:uncharacterized membrane protein